MNRSAVTMLFVVALCTQAEAKNISATAKSRVLDLRVKEMPSAEVSSLQMRVLEMRVLADASDTQPTPETSTVAPVLTPQLRSSYSPLPQGKRDLRKRVVFKTNVGYGLDMSRSSGLAGVGGLTASELRDAGGNALATQRHYLLGDAIVGSQGILRPSLNTYFLSRFRLDAGGTEFAARQTVYDSSDRLPLQIRAGYAEIKGLGGETGGFLDSIFVRAGRQFRYGADRFVSNFDGLSVAYDHRVASVSSFVGRRVSSFFDDKSGVVAGVGLKLHGDELLNYPIDLNMDYLRFDPGVSLPGRQLIEAQSRARVARKTLIYLRGRFIDDEASDSLGAGIGRLGASVRQTISHRLLLVVDAERNFAREVNYDYVGASPIDIINVGQSLGLGIGVPVDSTLLGARANYQVTRDIEAYAFYRNRIVHDAAQADAFSRPFQELGLAASSRIGKRVTTEAQYKYRRRTLQVDTEDMFEGGSKELHEISAQARYSLGIKKASASFGGYLRINQLETPFVSIQNDSLGGGRFDVGYWPTSLIRVRAEGEIARPSQTLSPDLDALMSVRLVLEASF